MKRTEPPLEFWIWLAVAAILVILAIYAAMTPAIVLTPRPPVDVG
jgi:hypothetical protein